MEYQDSHPERRNLTVIALGIIIYFLADGKMSDNTLKIQALNIEFGDSDKIIYFIWLAFFWSLYRYWVVSKKDGQKMFENELSEFRNNKIINNICKKNKLIIVPKYKEEGYFVMDLYHDNYRLYIKAGYCNQISWSDGYAKLPVGFGHQDERNIKIGGLDSMIVLGKIFIEKRTFSEFIVPYLIAYLTTLIFCYEASKNFLF